MKYSWLLFDADDTLFDYPKAEDGALRITFEHFGQEYRPDYLNIYHIFNQQVWHEFERGETTSQELRVKRFRLFFNEIHISLEPEAFGLHYLKNLAHCSDLFTGASEVLETLSGRCYIAIVTNGLSDVNRPRLERSVIRPFIEKIFVSEEIGVAKPEPGFFDAVFREIGQPEKSQVLIIGDSLSSDMRGGVNYGIDTCWFNPAGKTTELPVTYKINSLKQLLDILK